LIIDVFYVKRQAFSPKYFRHKVITGFNTDIDYNGVTYHVQTEDKGLETPLILSLVYNRGTILASKRSPYNDLLLGQFDERELAERLQRQHKLICAAIRAGRIEDLKKMNGKAGAASRKPETPPSPQVLEPKAQVELSAPPKLEQKVEKSTKELSSIQHFLQEKPKEFAPIKKPEIDLPKPVFRTEPPKIESKQNAFESPIEITDADLIFDDTQSLDETLIVPDEAVEIITSFSQAPEISDSQLTIELLNDIIFRGGDSKTVSILIGRGKGQPALVGVGLMIKVLGTNFRPLIFHTKTDSNGVATVHLQIPPFSRGRAAVLIKATINNETAELRKVIYAG
jgi:hypothetical protein